MPARYSKSPTLQPAFASNTTGVPEPQNVHSSATSPTSIDRCWARFGAPKAPVAVAAAAVVRNVRRAMALLILSFLRVCVLRGQVEFAGASLFVLTARR